MKILCLANSFKEGGRCLAGIQLDENNQPVIKVNRPVWIRPICNTEHSQIPTYLCAHIKVFDVIEIDNANIIAEGYQSENTTFDQDSLNVIGRIDKFALNNLCDNNLNRVVFGNRGKAVPEDIIQNINYSLMLIMSSNFQVIEQEYHDREYPQIRLTFSYNKASYNLPITDPVFLNDYKKNSELLDDKDEIFLVLSLGVPFKDWYYKLVAAIIH